MRARKRIILLSASALAIFIFWMGFIMGEEIQYRKIHAALKNNDTRTALTIWNDLKKDGVKVTKDPLFFLSFAKSFAKKGDMASVLFNIDQAIELMRK